MNLWRINIKPDAQKGIDPAHFCIDRSIIGIGWAVPGQVTSKEQYWIEAAKKGFKGKGWKSATNAILNRMVVGDLVWTRDRMQTYFLGRIISDWRFEGSQEYREADIANVRNCDWVRVGPMDEVPGKVLNSFRPSATLQTVSDHTAAAFSSFVFNRVKDVDICYIDRSRPIDILNLLSPDDLEDVVAIYLQFEFRHILYPSTCKNDTAHVEFLLSSQDGSRIGVQVKSGNIPLDRDAYRIFDGTVYLFAACGIYTGQESDNIVCLSPAVIREFVLKHRKLMPGRIQRWLDYADSCAK